MKRKLLIGLAIAACLVGGVGVGHASAATASDQGTVSCELYQKGGVQAKAQRDVDGYAPGGTTFVYNWGSQTWKTYRINGTQRGGGEWFAESQTTLDKAATYGYCYGG